MIGAIFATDLEGNFGNKDGSLPWKKGFKEDFNWFKGWTNKYKNMVMGVNTFNSLPTKLKGRFHIVISEPNYQPNQFKTQSGESPDLIITKSKVQTFEVIDKKLKQRGFDDYIVIGGTKLIADAIDTVVDYVYVSVIQDVFPADIKIHNPEIELSLAATPIESISKEPDIKFNIFSPNRGEHIATS